MRIARVFLVRDEENKHGTPQLEKMERGGKKSERYEHVSLVRFVYSKREIQIVHADKRKV
jgi:hypothetical protein